MSLFGGSDKAIGLDIGSGSIRAVELVRNKSQVRLVKVGSVPIPKGVVVDGEITSVAETASAIRELWKQAGFSGKRVTIGIANPKVIARQIELPYMDADALKGAIRFQAQEFVPISAQNLILDHQVVGEYANEQSQRMLRVLLVAAHKDMVEKFTAAVKEAGLTPWVVYLSSLALVRALVRGPVETLDVHAKAPKNKKKIVVPQVELDLPMADSVPSSTVIVNVGAGLSNVVVVEHGYTRFARVITFGGDDLTRSIAQMLDISETEAEQLKVAYGLPDMKEPEAATPMSEHAVPFTDAGQAAPPGYQQPYAEQAEADAAWAQPAQAQVTTEEPVAVNAPSADGIQADQVRSLLQREAYKFVDEVRRSIEYYFSQDISSLSIDRIVVTGGAAQMRNLPDFIGEALGVDVILGDPFFTVDVDERIKKRYFEGIDPYRLTAAIGLGLRGLDK